LCGTELREASPYVLALLLCDLLKFLFLAEILGFALDLLVGKVLTAGSRSKGVKTSLQSLEISSIHVWLRFDRSSLVSALFPGVSGHFFGISGSCGDSEQISGDSESY
jgi:hypothetical protein